MFGKLRNSSLTNYILFPSHYLSAPALSRDVMLNTTKVELELISDADMHLLFEKDMRSGVSCITKDTVKPTTSIWNLMNQNKNQNILYA